MLIDKDIEYYTYTNCIYYTEKVGEIYNELMEKYNTDLDWLDELYFDKIWKYISELSIDELFYFLKKIKVILINNNKKMDREFYGAYYGVLEWLIHNLLTWEYWELSKKFILNYEIQKYVTEELYDLIPYISNDYSKVWSLINNLNKKSYNNYDIYRYWDKFKIMVNENIQDWFNKEERKKMLEEFEKKVREKNLN